MEIAGFVRLTEQTVWRAIEEAGVRNIDWTARKEIVDSQPVIHVRLEPRPDCPFHCRKRRRRESTTRWRRWSLTGPTCRR